LATEAFRRWSGQARRTLTDTDIAILDGDTGTAPEALRATPAGKHHKAAAKPHQTFAAGQVPPAGSIFSTRPLQQQDSTDDGQVLVKTKKKLRMRAANVTRERIAKPHDHR
jgi:hypothetical protein